VSPVAEPLGPEHFRLLAVDEAESLFGGKLDRRRRYALLLGDVCEHSSYVVPCSGCACDCGDGYPCEHEGCGCHECGYTGRRRYTDWLNVNLARQLRADLRATDHTKTAKGPGAGGSIGTPAGESAAPPEEERRRQGGSP
jgi:hypothetical protein